MKINHARIAKNTAYLYARMAVNMIIGLYTSRLSVNMLGDAAYGVYGAIMALSVFVCFVPASVFTTADRFVSYSIGAGDKSQLKKTFSNVLFMYVSFSVLAVLAAISAGVWFLHYKIVVPQELSSFAPAVFCLCLLSFLFQVIGTPFSILINSHEKMDVIAAINIGENILKLALLLLMSKTLHSASNLIVVYSFMLALISFCGMSAAMLYSRKNFEETSFIPGFDKKMLVPMLKFYFSDFYNVSASNALGKGRELLQNIYFGPLANTAAVLAGQVNAGINGISSAILNALRPPLIKSYAAKQTEETNFLVVFGSELAALLMLLILVPMLFEAEFVIRLWLGRVPMYVCVFLRLIIINALLDNIFYALWQSIVAAGKIKQQSVLDGSLSFLSLAAIWAGYIAGLPAWICYAVPIVKSFICGTNMIFLAKRHISNFDCNVFIKKCVGRPFLYFAAMSLPGMIVFYLTSCCLSDTFAYKGIVRFVSVCSATTLAWAAIIAFYAFNREIRAEILKRIKRVFAGN
ncbi:MAG: hypothetical protein J5706_08210 [Elusimicrobiales bacterium]|nr:hypothetical protein [Elusimicrobiales bacterium]